MDEKITRRKALKMLLGSGIGIALAATGIPSLLTSCTSPKEKKMRTAKAASDASLLTRCDYCGECAPCPYHVAIPEVMKQYDEAIREGRLPDPQRESPKLLEHDIKEYNEGLKRIPRLSQADRCIGCRRCQCKQGIDIPLTLRRIEDIEEVVRDYSL